VNRIALLLALALVPGCARGPLRYVAYDGACLPGHRVAVIDSLLEGRPARLERGRTPSWSLGLVDGHRVWPADRVEQVELLPGKHVLVVFQGSPELDRQPLPTLLVVELRAAERLSLRALRDERDERFDFELVGASGDVVARPLPLASRTWPMLCAWSLLELLADPLRPLRLQGPRVGSLERPR